jgi:hypothetical protein
MVDIYDFYEFPKMTIEFSPQDNYMPPLPRCRGRGLG